jgi:hypothetical protein
MHKGIFGLSMAATLPLAFAASPVDGKWWVSLGDPYPRAVEVILVDGEGTWKFFNSSKAAILNPCWNRLLPVIVKSVSAIEVEIDIRGDSVLAGCFTRTLSIHRGPEDSWQGPSPWEQNMTMVWTRE